MGRTKLPDRDNVRDKHLAFWVSQNEKNKIWVKKGKIRLSTWLRNLALNADDEYKPAVLSGNYKTITDPNPMRFTKRA